MKQYVYCKYWWYFLNIHIAIKCNIHIIRLWQIRKCNIIITQLGSSHIFPYYTTQCTYIFRSRRRVFIKPTQIFILLYDYLRLENVNGFFQNSLILQAESRRNWYLDFLQTPQQTKKNNEFFILEIISCLLINFTLFR